MQHQLAPQPPNLLTINRRAVLAGGVASLAALAAPTAKAQAPEPSDTVWRDSARNRAVPVRLRWPAAQPPAPSGGWPVIIYSHGLGGSRAGGEVWGRAWADAGFVVVHVQHAGSDLDAIREASRTGLGRISIRDLGSAEQLRARQQDVVFVMQEMAQQKTFNKQWANVRVDAVGVAGHSFGAHTTLAVGGQAYASYASYASYAGMQEPRIAALVALSPTVPVAGSAVQAFANIKRPILCITGTLDGDVVGNGATPERRAAVYDALPAGGKAMLLLKDADHATFGGNAQNTADGGNRRGYSAKRDAAAAQLQSQHHALVARVTADWWRAHLLGDNAASARLAMPVGLKAQDVWRAG